ncbi:hypothetical protein C2E23DRAFT_738868 [Lenzites betulinus]|nr:hypothetical protein C2E23DRAFT_738868 [Lenzites betulinus]
MEQTNQTGEAVATLTAAQVADPAAPLLHITDSRTTLDAVTKRFSKYQDEGFICQKNTDLTRAIVATTLARRAHTAFQWVKGHNGHPGNKKADALAGCGARKPAPDAVDVAIPRQLRITGAKLSKITQKLAYKAIRIKKAAKAEERRRTKERVEQVIRDLEEDLNVHITPETLWKSLGKDIISREARQWIWMTLHDAYMVGTHWLRPNMSDELKERATCKTCGQTETMEHILFTCTAQGRETVWSLLRQAWTASGGAARDPSWGTILGAACTDRNVSGQRGMTVAENRWAILAIKSARLIWKLRCERVIANDGAEFTKREVQNRWHAEINRRLTLDRRVAALLLGKKRKRRIQLVEGIWSPLLEDERSIPPRWVTDSGVLVGIKRGRG